MVLLDSILTDNKTVLQKKSVNQINRKMCIALHWSLKFVFH